MSEVGRRLLHGLGAQVFARTGTTVTQIIGVPLLIHFWGVELYGEWLILSAIPVYFAMSDVGFGNVAGNEMAMRAAEGDRETTVRVFQSVWLLISAVSLAVIPLAVAVIWAGTLPEWLNLSRMGHSEAASTLTALLLLVGVSLQGGMVAAGFRSEKRYPQETFLSNLLYLLEYGIFLTIIALGARPAQAAWTSLLVRTAGTALMWTYLFRFAPDLRPGFRHARRSTVRRLAGPAVAFLAFPLGNAFSMQGMLLVVGALLGPVAVVTLSTLRTLLNAARKAMGMVNATVWPEISIAFGRRDLPLARVLHRRACQISFWVALLIVAMLALFGSQIVQMWTGGAVRVDDSFLYCMLLVLLANSLWFTSSVVPAAINRHQRMGLLFAIGTALSLVSAMALVQSLGLVGVAVSLLLIDSVMTFYVLRRSLHLLEDRLDHFVATVLHPGSLAWFLRSPRQWMRQT